ncbi:hypothetical protein AHMF7605_00735 [Adhaeribacter arboris]|uniref:Bacteriocin-protection protein n=1 Tax=Adhaeribacter arboris TaxID=2072846 RepID=A0A2T2Y9F2_9BACT|nr:YdeI/OmpD-associated family protein [Adhaeribacter arboris]PSR52151.1 hypothetical protein AHMF7605_00735 [Adhaeribacter arboris]
MELKAGIKTFYAATRAEWRQWLEENHQKEKSVWLIIYKKESKVPSVYYPEAVDEALCFGWIDSKANKRNAISYYQFFSKRKTKSKWSQVNKIKIEKLLADNLMAPAGLAIIEVAKQNGYWSALDEVEALLIPEDLQNALNNDKKALDNWNKFPRSAKRAILEWILNARRPETREKRITETVTLANKNLRANQSRP